MSGSAFGKYAGLVGAAVGVAAAGAAAGVLANRRRDARRANALMAGGLDLGTLRGDQHEVRADDGLELYAEIDEPAKASKGSVTVVFVHGYALNLGCWHFQREALRGARRLIFYDQRSHGRSDRSRVEHATFDQLGHDLAEVIDQLAPDEPIVLIGHSLGGMTVMALAEDRPEWFAAESRKVVGVCLISTSSGQVNAETLGLPPLSARVLRRLAPPVVSALAHAPRLVDSGRRVGADISYELTRRLAFGGPVDGRIVEFTDQMLSATPFDVVAEFFPGFDTHDKTAALAALTTIPLDIVCGTKDAITPIQQSIDMAALVDGARLVEIDGGGHMVLLEKPGDVTAAIEDLVERAEDGLS